LRQDISNHTQVKHVTGLRKRTKNE